jgi:hypothetical protein
MTVQSNPTHSETALYGAQHLSSSLNYLLQLLFQLRDEREEVSCSDVIDMVVVVSSPYLDEHPIPDHYITLSST